MGALVAVLLPAQVIMLHLEQVAAAIHHLLHPHKVIMEALLGLALLLVMAQVEVEAGLLR
jgi:hypothetical protein